MANRYSRIIEQIFHKHYKEGAKEVPFRREEMATTAKKLKIELPKNLGDVIYSFRYRVELPPSIRGLAPRGQHWIIRPAGASRYRFVLVKQIDLQPNESLLQIKVPDATPGLISKYALSDEQALLAKLRYNRLIDVFSGVSCYSLQSHLRTTAKGIGQVETDEIYVGVDSRGAHYVFPVQAKGGRDKLSVVQIEQDVAVCREKFPDLICRPIAAQFMANDVLALFELVDDDGEIAVAAERHYRLVLPEELTTRDLEIYRGLQVGTA